jgi:hypothetical protein
LNIYEFLAGKKHLYWLGPVYLTLIAMARKSKSIFARGNKMLGRLVRKAKADIGGRVQKLQHHMKSKKGRQRLARQIRGIANQAAVAIPEPV